MTLSFAPDRIEMWPLAKLQPYARNAKAHGADQVAKISASMAEFGWTVPCLVGEDGELIAGHGRVLAATQLGLTEAPVIVLGHLTEAQRRAYRIADNKLTELGTWDEALLSAELNDLLAEDFDLSLVGFSDGELDKLLAFVPEEDGQEGGAGGSVPPVTIPEPPRNPASRTGDLWILGDHRLLCGDSTSAADVRRLMNGERAILFATDPPYLVDYDGSNHPTRNKDWSASYGTTWDDSSQGAELYDGFIAAAVAEAWTLPSMSIETGMPEVPRYAMYSGCVLDQITWQMQRSGLLTATARLVAQGETVGTTTSAGTPAALELKRFGHFNGAITRNGSALGNVVSAEITCANNLDRIETIRSDGRIDGADPSIAALTGRIEVRFADQTLVTQAINGEACEMEFAYVLPSGESFTFTVHAVYLPRPRIEISGPQGVQATFDWQAARDSVVGRMCTATLINDIEVY